MSWQAKYTVMDAIDIVREIKRLVVSDDELKYLKIEFLKIEFNLKINSELVI